MRTIVSIIVAAYFVLLIAHTASASSPGDIREGNRLYKQEKYSEAADRYSQALKESPDSDIAHFNLGDALYKKGQYREAIDSFTKALSTDNRSLEANAIYNLANSKYKLGTQTADSDVNTAIRLYREALDYYKQAIEMKNGDKDAAYNHELVEKKLKVLLDQLKNQQKDQDKNKDQQQQQQEKKDKQDTQQAQGTSDQKKEEEKQQAKQEGRQSSGDRDQGTKKDMGRSGAKDDNKGTKPSGGRKDDSEGMSAEEARMLLDAYGQEGTIDDRRENRGYADGVVKDW